MADWILPFLIARWVMSDTDADDPLTPNHGSSEYNEDRWSTLDALAELPAYDAWLLMQCVGFA